MFDLDAVLHFVRDVDGHRALGGDNRDDAGDEHGAKQRPQPQRRPAALRTTAGGGWGDANRGWGYHLGRRRRLRVGFAVQLLLDPGQRADDFRRVGRAIFAVFREKRA